MDVSRDRVVRPACERTRNPGVSSRLAGALPPELSKRSPYLFGRDSAGKAETSEGVPPLLTLHRRVEVGGAEEFRGSQRALRDRTRDRVDGRLDVESTGELSHRQGGADATRGVVRRVHDRGVRRLLAAADEQGRAHRCHARPELKPSHSPTISPRRDSRCR